jgi:hypothetical protein
VFWITAIQLIVGTLIMFFFMEEVSPELLARNPHSYSQTNYNRGTSEMVEKHDDGQSRSVGLEASPISDAEKEAVRDNVQHIAVPVELDGVEYSFVQKLRMLDQRYTSNAVLLQMMYRPFLHLRFPVVFW